MKTSQLKPMSVRLPDELRIWLKHQSVDNRRTLAAEIIHRLESSRQQQEALHAKT